MVLPNADEELLMRAVVVAAQWLFAGQRVRARSLGEERSDHWGSKSGQPCATRPPVHGARCVRQLRGRKRGVIRYHQESRKAFEEAGDGRRAAVQGTYIGNYAIDLGQLASESALRESLEMADRLALHNYVGLPLRSGRRSLATGRLREAFVSAKLAADMFEEQGDPRMASTGYTPIARIHRLAGRLSEAEEVVRKARLLGDVWPSARASASAELACILLATGRLEGRSFRNRRGPLARGRHRRT